MADFIDVTKIKETRDFFRPREETAGRKKIYAWLILIGSITLFLLVFGLWGMEGNFTQVTGNPVLESKGINALPNNVKESSDVNEQGLMEKARSVLFGKESVQDVQASESESSALTNKPAYQAKNIDIQSELQLSEYAIELRNAHLHITAQSHELKSSAQDLVLETGGQADIEGFTGILKWENNRLTLEGEMGAYKNANTEVRWKNQQSYNLYLEEGSISIENAQISSLVGLASGPVEIGNKLTLNTEKDLLSLKEYEGSITSELRNHENTLSLKGHVGELESKTNQFDMQLG